MTGEPPLLLDAESSIVIEVEVEATKVGELGYEGTIAAMITAENGVLRLSPTLLILDARN